jgi:hypothetical protein
LQNADDARAENVDIEFQTEDHARKLSGYEATDGTNFDLIKAKVSKFLNTNGPGSQRVVDRFSNGWSGTMGRSLERGIGIASPT